MSIITTFRLRVRGRSLARSRLHQGSGEHHDCPPWLMSDEDFYFYSAVLNLYLLKKDICDQHLSLTFERV